MNLDDWRNWNYEVWNSRLVEYCLTSARDGRTSPVERIPATPEELAAVAGVSAEDSYAVVDAFVGTVVLQLPQGRSFCGFCNDRRGWKPSSPEAPHFFAMLWFTCLVAYGYPDTEANYSRRMKLVFDRQLPIDCLPKLWEDLSTWCLIRSRELGRRPRYRELVLPPKDDYRSNIGYSWFLAFPHRNDRRSLRRALLEYDLVGDEPPIAPVVDLLLRKQEDFSTHFKQDLTRFREYFSAGKARTSAFWRAVRQEALAIPNENAVRSPEQDLFLMAFFGDYDEPEMYIGCGDETVLPEGIFRKALAAPVGQVTHYLEHGTTDSAMKEAVHSCFLGKIGKWGGKRFVSRGVVVFREEIANEYRAVGGSEADGCDLALVGSRHLSAFMEAYGGRCLPSGIPDWTFVVGCRIIVRGRPPSGLEDVAHLHETMLPPTVRIVGGIRASSGYLANPDFLPRIRFSNATEVRLIGTNSTVYRASRDDNDLASWLIPKSIVLVPPQEWSVEAIWEDEQGTTRISETSIEFVLLSIRYDYKTPASGRYWVEGVHVADVERLGGQRLADEIDDETEVASDIENDFLWSQSDHRYLGPGLGEISSKCRATSQWLSLGPPNSPSALAFIGDTESPLFPSGFHAQDKKAQRHWRKALNVTQVAVLKGGLSRSPTMFPEVARALGIYRREANTKRPCLGSLGQLLYNGASDQPRTVPVHRSAIALADAVAAQSVLKAGLGRKEYLQMLELAFEPEVTNNPRLLHCIARSWVEAGLVDTVLGQGYARHLVVARNPRVVAFRVGGVVRASLTGLVPRSLEERAVAMASSLGIFSKSSGTLSPWTPPRLKLEAESFQDLEELSRRLDLQSPPMRLPNHRDSEIPFELDPWQVKLREGQPPNFECRGSWNFDEGSMGPPAPKLGLGVHLELRGSIYAVGLDGKDEFWTFSRTWAILFAYVLRDPGFRLPFTVQKNGDLVSLHPSIYLPLAAARYVNVLSAFCPGPVLPSADSEVGLEYRYPLAASILRRLFPKSQFYRTEPENQMKEEASRARPHW